MNAQEVEKSEDDYEEMLNDVYGTVNVCGMEMDPGSILREMDPIAFRCGLSDEPIRWQCDKCGDEFDDEDKAEECCAPDEDL